MNYRNVYRALAIKDAINVLFSIYEGCKIEEYLTFDDIVKKLNKPRGNIRRITNRLSSCGVIRSIKANTQDKRKRVYVVNSVTVCDLIKELTQEIMDN
jgi:predicted transcriptional regulator